MTTKIMTQKSLTTALLVLFSLASGCAQPTEPNADYWNAFELARGQDHLANQRYAEAAESFRRLLTAAADHAEGHAQLGVTYLALGDFAKAEAALREAMRLDPSCGRVQRDLGRALALQEKFTDSIPHLENDRAAHPEDWTRDELLGLCLMRAGRAEECAALLGEGTLAGQPLEQSFLTLHTAARARSALGDDATPLWEQLKHRFAGTIYADPATPAESIRLSNLLVCRSRITGTEVELNTAAGESLVAAMITRELNDEHWMQRRLARRSLELLYDSGVSRPFILELLARGVAFEARFVADEDLEGAAVRYDAEARTLRIARRMRAERGTLKNRVHFKSALIVQLWHAYVHQVEGAVLPADAAQIAEGAERDMILRRMLAEGRIDRDDASSRWDAFATSLPAELSVQMGWGVFADLSVQ